MSEPNAELAYRVLDHIDAHPTEWDQATWKCGSSHCFGGWAVVLSGATVDYSNDELVVVAGPDELLDLEIEDAARQALGVTPVGAYVENFNGPGRHRDPGWLFGASNTRAELGRMVEAIFGPRQGGPS